MSYERLDDEELLGLVLEAMGQARDADAMVMLKELVDRSPSHAHGRYLLAAQYAQLGMLERAEEAFRAAIALAPGLSIARLQLGQLLLVRGDLEEARVMLQSVGDADPAIEAYAIGLCALAESRQQDAVTALQRGLALRQAIPELAQDMRRLLEGIQGTPVEDADVAGMHAAPMLLSNYTRHH